MLLPEPLDAESFDIEQPGHMEAYLRAAGYLGNAGSVDVTSLTGGVSNRTVLARFSDGREWVIKQALEKLRVQADWFCDPQRIHREAAGLRLLNELTTPGSVVPFVFEDFELHLLGMGAVPQPHVNFKAHLMAAGPDAGFIAEFGKMLGTIQLRARQKCAELASEFADRSFFEDLRLEPYFGFAAVQVPEAASCLEELIQQNRTEAQGKEATLVHGDFSPKNILIYENRLVLLDHEVIHWGDASFDAGFALAHFLSKGHHFTASRAAFGEAASTFWQAFSMARGGASPALEARVIAQTLGCLLARVAGRSPLEYLDASEKEQQKKAVLKLMKAPPATLESLTAQFLEQLPLSPKPLKSKN